MTKKCFLLVLLMSIEVPAHGMVYTWSDSSGIRHYVNREYDIPPRYRARAKALYPEPSDALAPQPNMSSQNIQAPAIQPPTAKTEQTPKVTAVEALPKPKPRHKTKLGIDLKKSVGRHKPKPSPEEE
jgi:hypothetical protein